MVTATVANIVCSSVSNLDIKWNKWNDKVFYFFVFDTYKVQGQDKYDVTAYKF